MPTVEDIRSVVRGRVGIGVVHAADLDDLARGRAAAADALAAIGAAPAEIPTGPNRAPVWPAGLVGSISHTAGVAIAIAARSSDFRGLGIDIESSGRAIDPRTAKRIRTEAERDSFTEPGALLALFCAKEATYKALAPLGATGLGFSEVEFTRPAEGMLIGRIVGDRPGLPHAFAARTTVADGFVIAAVQIDR